MTGGESDKLLEMVNEVSSGNWADCWYMMYVCMEGRQCPK